MKHPVEAIVTVKLPDLYGPAPTASIAHVTIDVVSQLRQYAASLGDMKFEYQYPVPDLYELIDALLEPLVDRDVTAALAGLADIDAALVAQPRELHLVAGQTVVQLLVPDGLAPIPDAGTSMGGIFRANPALDLRVAAERHEQVDNWVRQLGLVDAGLTGMEALLERYRATTKA
ncbi:hypothetical protein [Streptomyces sp. NPDC002671]